MRGDMLFATLRVIMLKCYLPRRNTVAVKADTVLLNYRVPFSN
jgi:hypothetical protein